MSKKALVGDYVVALAGRGLAISIGIVTIGVLVRYLGEEGYGAYLLAVVFLSVITTIGNFGFALGQLHMLGRGEIEESRVVGGFISLRLIVGATCLALAPLVILLFDYSDQVRWLVMLGIIPFFFTYVSAALGPIFQKHLIMGRASVAALIERTTFLALVFGCVALQIGTNGVMLSLGIAGAVAFTVRLLLVRSVVSTRPRYEPEVWKAAWNYGWPIAVLTAMGLLATHADLLLLGQYRGEAEVGLYGVPFRILVMIVSVLPTTFMGLMIPQLSRAWFANEYGAFRDHVQSAFDFLVVVVLPMVVGTLARAEDILVMVGGADLAPAGDILRILILAGGAAFFSLLYGHISLSTERVRYLIPPTALVCVLTVTAYFVFIPSYGVWGAAWGRAFQAVLLCVLHIVVLHPDARHMPRLRVATRAAVAAGVMGGVLYWLPPIHVLLDLGLGVVVYGVLLLATGAVRVEQIRATLATLRK